MIEYLLSFFLGYSIGSFPTAYLLVKWKARVDIRRAGSGNVGTLNAFEVTSSKLLAFCVLSVDLAKGSSAAWFSLHLIGHDIWILGAGGIGTIIGHNYPIWLGFKGGRGLAPAAGVMLVLCWWFVVLWCVVWIAMYAYARSVHISNIAASVLTPVAASLTPGKLQAVVGRPDLGHASLVLVLSAVCFLILLRHLQYFPELRGLIHKSH